MATAKRKTAKKSVAKKAVVKKTAAKKTAVKKTPVAKKAPASRTVKKAAPAARKKPVVKRTSVAKKTTAAKKPTAAPKAVESVTLGAVAPAVPGVEQAFAFGNDMFTQMFGNAKAELPQQAAEASRQFTEQGAEQLAKASDAASRSLNDAIELSKDNAEAVIESGNIAAGASKTVGAELFNYANKAFSQNVEISKELFSCRTLNDMFDLQSRIMKSNLDGFFSESVKISELVFEAANNAAEPLQERMQETAERVNKNWTDVA